MKAVCKITLAGLLAIGMAVSSASAADERSEGGASFEGKVSSFDKSAQTIEVDNKTYQLLPTSRITKHDQPGSMSDLAVGAKVEGQYKKSSENKLEVLSLDVTKEAEAEMGGSKDRATSESGATFRGRVENVNRSANTIRVGNRTYQVLPTTVVTTPTGRDAGLGKIREGQRVSGTYKESAEGKYELLSIEVDRRARD